MLELRKIMLVFGLLLLILQTAACVERFCSFTQSDPCYAALGHKLNLQMVNASKYKLTIIKRIDNTDDAACRVRNDTKRANECDLYINRPEVKIINGTVMINPVKREDSGDFRIQFNNPDGTETSQDLQVNVEAPVGSVEVSVICSSNQMRSVSCSSEGDQLLYSWTLNGETLMDENRNIYLEEGTEGEITCTVKNHVSKRQKTVSTEDCSVTSSSLTTSNWVSHSSMLVIYLMILFALLGGFHIYIHTQVRKERRSKPDDEEI
ncbi:uncharacterized protein isoform X1 [Danio rerio]|uniref:Uncharacterized protein isoform X1 n=1 Tax=Danio rerio TaxID=7955 RepID=A0A8M9Q008_DANRE|nr:uncharacterized protein LOC110437825 [Danio rerio]|eukprot:XP_021336962.1 uncharacterized protein LOC110437825 [Danio rerio]